MQMSFVHAVRRKNKDSSFIVESLFIFGDAMPVVIQPDLIPFLTNKVYKTIQHSRVTFYEKIKTVIVPRNILIAKPILIPL